MAYFKPNWIKPSIPKEPSITDVERRKFYKSKEWKYLRDKYIAEFPWCEVCLKRDRAVPAQNVHHKISIEERWDLRLEWSNLESVDVGCHNRYRRAKD